MIPIEDNIGNEPPRESLLRFEKYLLIYECFLYGWEKDIKRKNYDVFKKRIAQYSFCIDEFFEGTSAFEKTFRMFYEDKIKNPPDKYFKKDVADTFFRLFVYANNLNERASDDLGSPIVVDCRMKVLANSRYEWEPGSQYAEWNSMMRKVYDLYRESIDCYIESRINDDIKLIKKRLGERKRNNKKPKKTVY